MKKQAEKKEEQPIKSETLPQAVVEASNEPILDAGDTCSVPEAHTDAVKNPEANALSNELMGELFSQLNGILVSRVFPEAPLTDAEREALKKALTDLLAFYGFDAIPPWLAVWLQLAGALGTVYGMRWLEEHAKNGQDSIGTERDRKNDAAEESCGPTF